MLPIINKETMLFDINVHDKDEIIQLMVDTFAREGYLNDREQFLNDVLDREKVFSTYIDYGIGIPHGKSPGVKEPGVCIARLSDPVKWTEDEDEKVDLVLMIAVQNQIGNDLHMQILSQLSRQLMHESFREIMKHEDRESIYKVLSESLGEK